MSFFNLKNKFLLSGLLILSLVTGFNLYYSYKIFKDDKEAYIYENVLRSAEMVGRSFQERIELAKDYLSKNKMKDSLSAVYEKKSTELIPIKISSDFKLSSDLESKLKKLPKGNKELYGNFLVEHKKNKIFVIDIEDIVRLMDTDNIFKYVIFLNDKRVYGEGFVDKKYFEDSSNVFVKEIEVGESKLLVGSIKSDSSNYRIVSYIDYNKAFAALNYILKKNIYFCLILFGIVMVLTLLFARTITTPILNIISKTSEISKGNYDSEVLVRTSDELSILGDSVNQMSQDIKVLLSEKQDMINQLDEYNKNLEKIVAERTKELSDANAYIKAMVNSLTQGLFVVEKGGLCSPFYTNSCKNLFGRIPEGEDFKSYISKDDSSIDNWLDIVFSEKLPFDSARGLGPKHYIVGEYGESHFQFVNLDYYPLLIDDSIEGIVVVATDITSKIIAEEEVKEKENYINSVIEFLTNKDAVLNLVEESKELLNEVEELEFSKDFFDRSMMVFHTINGGFATYSFRKVQMFARSIEEYITKNDKDELNSLKVKEYATQTIELIESEINELKDKFEVNDGRLVLDRFDKAYLENELASFGERGALILDHLINHKSLSSSFLQYEGLIHKLSTKLDKPMNNLCIEPSLTRVRADNYKEFFSSIVHLFRNCMDHGIEETSLRLENGKPEHGSIKVRISECENNFTIMISDDGKGIDVDRIREKIVDAGENSDLKEFELLEKIFEPNFSTRESVTELSGRGVGMSAVKASVEKLGGSLKVQTDQNIGSKFVFTLPKSSLG